MYCQQEIATTDDTSASSTPTSARARDREITDHLNVVHFWASRLNDGSGAGVPYEDLFAYGCQGLIEAVDNYNPSRGVPFVGYATLRVRGAILDGIRAFHRIPRRTYEQLESPRHLSLDTDSAASTSATLDCHRWNGYPLFCSPPPEEAQLSTQLLEGLAELPPLERRLLELCYFEGKSLCDAGAELGMQRSWASRLHARALAELAATLA